MAQLNLRRNEPCLSNGIPESTSYVETTSQQQQHLVEQENPRKHIGKTRNVLRIDTLVGFNTGDVITGKCSKAGGTIDSTQQYTGHFDLSSDYSFYSSVLKK